MSSPAADPQSSDEGVTVHDTSASATEGGTFFGRYKTVRELGRGGMGLVVLAHDAVLDIPVALKLIPEIVVRDSEGIVDLKKEVLRGMELTHPNIVRVFSFEQDAKSAVIVMEHVQGETLAQKKIKQPHRCFECDEVLPWVEQLCAALDYAHSEARIAHRDLKPGNLLLTNNGRLKVVDFGISSSLSETMTRVSIRKDTAGTPPYMSPQQAMGERPTHLDDIYSFGATIYELLTGKPPFFRGNILAQVMNEEPISMTQRRSELGVTGMAPIPETWEAMIAACLSKNPEARPGSGAAVLAMLSKSAPMPVVTTAKVNTEPKHAAIPKPEALPKVSRPAVPTAPAFDSAVSPRVMQRARAKEGGGLFSAIGSVFRFVAILALLAGGVWGALALKKRWDADKTPESQAAAPVPASAAPPTPAPAKQSSTPAPSMLDRGTKTGVQGATGLQPSGSKK